MSSPEYGQWNFLNKSGGCMKFVLRYFTSSVCLSRSHSNCVFIMIAWFTNGIRNNSSKCNCTSVKFALSLSFFLFLPLSLSLSSLSLSPPCLCSCEVTCAVGRFSSFVITVSCRLLNLIFCLSESSFSVCLSLSVCLCA